MIHNLPMFRKVGGTGREKTRELYQYTGMQTEARVGTTNLIGSDLDALGRKKKDKEGITLQLKGNFVIYLGNFEKGINRIFLSLSSTLLFRKLDRELFFFFSLRVPLEKASSFDFS